MWKCGDVPPARCLRDSHQWQSQWLAGFCGNRQQHSSQGLSGTVTQRSCWYAYTTESQSSYSIVDSPVPVKLSAWQWAVCQDLPLSRDVSQSYSLRLTESLLHQIHGK